MRARYYISKVIVVVQYNLYHMWVYTRPLFLTLSSLHEYSAEDCVCINRNTAAFLPSAQNG